MPEFPIENLPTDLQGLVVQRVVHNGCKDLFRLRATCKSMRALTDDAEVYASLDMLSIPWRIPGFMLPPLLKRCYQEGNPSTLYIKGVEYLYIQDRHVEGLALIKRAADACYQPASYTYAMTTKIWVVMVTTSVDLQEKPLLRSGRWSETPTGYEISIIRRISV
ncbi:F-box protein At2g35280-like [Raphanus sativus]|uniref:F-box protein At2g35280-like n=1 Tax=Raphanus sativus TaxID=3726 RepID=A0A6J0LV93_RAPSA|nr:F-box protein At2g35280-like [Raphanus sativus]